MTSAGDERRPASWSSILAGLVALASAAGALTGAVGALVVLRPNLAASTANEAKITNVAIEPRTTLDEYVRHPTVARVLGDPGPFLDLNRSAIETVGVVVHFDFEVVGYNRRSVGFRWTLFDAQSGDRLGESEDLDPLPLAIRKFEKKEADIGSWESWVYAEGAPGRFVFVRLELFDRVVGLRLVFHDTSPFRLP